MRIPKIPLAAHFNSRGGGAASRMRRVTAFGPRNPPRSTDLTDSPAAEGPESWMAASASPVD
jgi:hypothetical protein